METQQQYCRIALYSSIHHGGTAAAYVMAAPKQIVAKDTLANKYKKGTHSVKRIVMQASYENTSTWITARGPI
jgi:hypothetical protein